MIIFSSVYWCLKSLEGRGGRAPNSSLTWKRPAKCQFMQRLLTEPCSQTSYSLSVLSWQTESRIIVFKNGCVPMFPYIILRFPFFKAEQQTQTPLFNGFCSIYSTLSRISKPCTEINNTKKTMSLSSFGNIVIAVCCKHCHVLHNHFTSMFFMFVTWGP